ncbi:hypothetical protein AGMMS49938_11910 [Fibrobacterales bacterium]|nr:hypothetical protein AGMMS49938_11910 [Fibrobacterales bacterium]
MNNILLLSQNTAEKFTLGANDRLCILSLNSQNEIEVELKGEGAVFEYRSLATQTISQKIHIFHNAPNTESFLFARHILSGDSRANFNGIIEAGKNCPNVKSRQIVNSLLLSPNARAISKPELKIYCDAVECYHGATCGNLSEDDLFYLQSRGMTLENAKKILQNAFAKEVAREHPSEEQKEKWKKILFV